MSRFTNVVSAVALVASLAPLAAHAAQADNQAKHFSPGRAGQQTHILAAPSQNDNAQAYSYVNGRPVDKNA